MSLTTTGGNGMIPQSMTEAVHLAEMMARGKMMPEHLRGSAGDCLMVVEQAMRWRMSPFAVAQCTSSVKGKLMYEGKLVAAAVETSGAKFLQGSTTIAFSNLKTGDNVIVQGTVNGTSVTASTIIDQGQPAAAGTTGTAVKHSGFLGGIFGGFLHMFGF